MCMWWLFTMLFVSFWVASLVSFGFVPELWGFVRLRSFVFLSWVEPGDEFVNEEPVEYAYEDQAFVNSENFVGKMTIPSKSLLSLLARCSFYFYAAIPTTCYIMPPILPFQASNHPFLANRCLAMLPLLLRPSYSVASCRWSWSLFHVGTWICWDITISLI